MLVDGMSGKQITRPSFYDSTYKLVRTRLSRAEIDQAIAAITSHIVGKKNRVEVGAYLQPKSWQVTPFAKVYNKAAKEDFDLCGKMVGLLAMEAFIRHPEEWITVKTQLAGHELENRVYWRKAQTNDEMKTDEIIDVISKDVEEDTLFEIVKGLCAVHDAFGPVYLRMIHMRAERLKRS